MPPSRAAARAPQPQPQATSFNYSHRSKFFCTYCGKKWKVCHTIRPTYCWRCRIPGCAAVSRKVASAAEDFNAPLIQTADTVAEDAKKDDAKVVSGPPAPDAADSAALWAMAKAVAQSPAAAAATGAHVPAEVLETFLFQRADTEPSEGSQAAGAEWPREEIRDFLTDPSRYNFREPKPDPPGQEGQCQEKEKETEAEMAKETKAKKRASEQEMVAEKRRPGQDQRWQKKAKKEASKKEASKEDDE